MNRLKRASVEALWLAASAVVLGFVTTGIRGKGLFEDPHSAEAGALMSPAPTMIQLAEARGLFESGQGLFLDARHPFEFAQGHIRGATNLPLAEFDQRLEFVDTLPRDRVLVTYCDGVECNSSVGLAARLREAGFPRVRIFFAGWNEWQEHGLPTGQSSP